MSVGKGLLLLCVTLFLSGCVTKETHTAQVNRTINLQRLLAEEEKRSADLAGEIARLKKQAGDLEMQNKGLTAQLTDTRAQIVRSLEEVGRLQDEIQRARKGQPSAEPGRGKPATAPAPTEPPDRLGELSGETSGSKKSKGAPPAPEPVVPPPAVAPPKPAVAGPAPVEPPDRLSEIQGEAPGGKKAGTNASSADTEQAYRYHVVKKGDTLSNIARLYKTDVKTLRELNDITGSDIRIGDRLIIGKKE
jgi:LysM repeat protein